jgi:hypothetical protein
MVTAFICSAMLFSCSARSSCHSWRGYTRLAFHATQPKLACIENRSSGLRLGSHEPCVFLLGKILREIPVCARQRRRAVSARLCKTASGESPTVFGSAMRALLLVSYSGARRGRARNSEFITMWSSAIGEDSSLISPCTSKILSEDAESAAYNSPSKYPSAKCENRRRMKSSR